MSSPKADISFKTAGNSAEASADLKNDEYGREQQQGAGLVLRRRQRCGDQAEGGVQKQAEPGDTQQDGVQVVRLLIGELQLSAPADTRARMSSVLILPMAGSLSTFSRPGGGYPPPLRKLENYET